MTTTDPTTAPADQLDLDAIEARAEAATPGPWGTVDDGSLMAPYVSVACDDGPIITCPECHTAGGGRRADAKFIARTRTDVPALVAEVRRLRAMLDLPAGIRWDLTRWRCDRCDATGTWTGDTDPAAVDPVTAAAAEAHRHAADHQRWDAERLSATPPETAPCQCRAFPMHPTSTCPNHQTSAPPEPTGGEQDG